MNIADARNGQVGLAVRLEAATFDPIPRIPENYGYCRATRDGWSWLPMLATAKAPPWGGSQVCRTPGHDRASRIALQTRNNFPICRGTSRRGVVGREGEGELLRCREGQRRGEVERMSADGTNVEPRQSDYAEAIGSIGITRGTAHRGDGSKSRGDLALAATDHRAS